MKSILDPTFRYTSSANTDLRKTFARVRYEQEKAKRELAEVKSIGPRAAPEFKGPRRTA